MLDRSAKQFFAVSLLTIGLLMLVNLSVSRETMTDWSWVIALAALLGAAYFAVLLWLETRPAKEVRSITLNGTGSLQLPQSQAQIFEVNPVLQSGTEAKHTGHDPLPFDTLGDDTAAASPVATVEYAAAAPTHEAAESGHETYATSSEAVDTVAEDTSHETYAVSSEAVESPVEVEAQIEEYAPSSEAVSVASPVSDVDDMQEIEGIGPKYEQALYSAGITKWAQLAETSTEQLTDALHKGGYTRIPTSISTWAEQAGYLVRGDQEGLKVLQEQLIGGRRTDSGDD